MSSNITTAITWLREQRARLAEGALSAERAGALERGRYLRGQAHMAGLALAELERLAAIAAVAVESQADIAGGKVLKKLKLQGKGGGGDKRSKNTSVKKRRSDSPLADLGITASESKRMHAAAEVPADWRAKYP